MPEGSSHRRSVRHPTSSIDKDGLRELEELQCGLDMFVLQWNQ